MKFVVEVIQKHNIDISRIADLLYCAFEGGSNYWYQIKRKIEPKEITFISEVEDYLTPALNPGGCLVIVDRENVDGQEYYLDLDSIQIGLQKMAKDQPYHMKTFLEENEDAETGDVFLQFCLFGEIIFG